MENNWVRTYDPNQTRALTIQQVVLLFKFIKTPRTHIITRLMMLHGFRTREVCLIRPCDIDAISCVVTIGGQHRATLSIAQPLAIDMEIYAKVFGVKDENYLFDANDIFVFREELRRAGQQSNFRFEVTPGVLRQTYRHLVKPSLEASTGD